MLATVIALSVLVTHAQSAEPPRAGLRAPAMRLAEGLRTAAPPPGRVVPGDAKNSPAARAHRRRQAEQRGTAADSGPWPGMQYSSGATALCIFYLVGILFIGANLALAVFCIFRVDKPTKLTTSALVQLHSLNDYIKMLESLQKPDRNDFQDLDKLLKQLERRYENICSVIDTIASISDERTLPRKLAVKGSVQSKTTD